MGAAPLEIKNAKRGRFLFLFFLSSLKLRARGSKALVEVTGEGIGGPDRVLSSSNNLSDTRR